MDELIGISHAIAVVREQAQQLVSSERRAQRLPPVLLQGETGTGKGLVARLLHRGGPWGKGPFIDVSCAAIPDTLLESELFGFERGAFTDARQAKPGLFQAAHRGTIFLDEVALLPQNLQAKLLKAIEERAVRRLGSTRAEAVDLQIIAASNEDLAAAARTGDFRSDLYHRLAVVTLTLPPLRERPEDVLLLAEHFMSRACADYGLAVPRRLARDAQAALLEYPWPGNVRELSNVIERVVLLADAQTITAAMLQLPVRYETDLVQREEFCSFDDRLGSIEREQLVGALRDTNWNISLAAVRLGISRNRLRYRIEKYGLRSGQYLIRRRTRDVQSPRASVPVSAVDDAVTRVPSPRLERRHLAILRAECVTSAAAGALPDLVRALDVIAGKIQSFGGEVQDLSAMTIVGAFGLKPIENAPNSAALAALAIQKAAERAQHVDSRVSGVKIAVHCDQLTVGLVDGVAQISLEDKRGTEATLAKLGELGQPNSILVSAAAAPFLERRFELAPSSVECGGTLYYRLNGRERTGFGLAGRALTGFVGRQRELAVVSDQLLQAQRGNGQIVAVVGEPGVGKSRFAYELSRAERMAGWQALSCRAVPYGITTPSLPVVELLKTYFQIDEAETQAQIREKVSRRVQEDGRLASHLPALLALLDVSDDDPRWAALEPPQRRQRTIDGVKQVLLSESLAGPLLLIFEDLHWIDTETQGLLDSLIESLPAARVLLLVTYRPEYRHRWGVKTYYTQLHLDPLMGDSAQALLQELMGEDPSLLSLKRLLIERTEGNPLFLEESVRALVETRTLVGPRGAYRLDMPAASLEVPATVQAILSARIDRLSPQDKRLLQAAAVTGKDISVALLSAIAELPQETVRESLGHLQTAEFVYETSRHPDLEYTFKHALTYEVAYSSLSQERRGALHARIVDVIEALHPNRTVEYAERLAHHSFRAELWPRALQYLRQAGIRAFSRSANREAVAWFDQALVVLEHLPETRDRLQQAIDLRFDLRGALLALGELSQLSESLREAEALAETLGDQRRLASAFAYRGYLLHAIGNQQEAMECERRAIRVSEIAEDPGVTVVASYYLGLIHHSLGDYQAAMQCHTRTAESLDGERVRERFGMAGFPAVMARSYLGWSLAELGQFVDAVAIGRESVRLAQELNQSYSQALAEGWLGGVYLRKGALNEAICSLEHSLTLCESMSFRLLFPIVASFLGPAYALSGQLSRAISLLELALETAASMGTMHYRSLEVAALSETYLLAGRISDAVPLARQALELSQAQKERGWEAWILRLMAEIESHREPLHVDEVKRLYGQALSLAKETGMRPLAARCHLGLGELAQKVADAQEVQEQLTNALMMVREMGMQYWLQRAESALKNLSPR